ncbi:MAG: hydrogenase maturation protease [Bacteroidales bacterium]|nr:hydrogenase maturation protease [Bacteroidales bacterium]MBN2634145.1 hydrogenase maturation protease [Bacteroidales bacterium]
MTPELENLLSLTGKKILFVGIGNVLRSDDGAGVYISNNIKPHGNIASLTVEVSIENYIGKINSLNPDILILIDCVEMNEAPGRYKLLKAGEVSDLTFNTHNISLARITEFFRAEVYILGIQPAGFGFGENISYLVRSVSDEIINLINDRR